MRNREIGDDRLDPFQKVTTEIADLPATPSFSFDDANCVFDIEVQADQLLAYIDRLTSLADRACDSAIRQTETAQLLEKSRSSELSRVRDQLEQQRDQYQEQQLALVRLEHQSRAQVAALESRLQDLERQNQNSDLQAELLRLKEENAALAAQVAAAPVGREAGERRSRPAQPTPMASDREGLLESPSRLVQEIEAQSRAQIASLEQRLATLEAEMLAQESKLKEKESLIAVAAAKERELGNLIKRLSAECAALTAEQEGKVRAPVETAKSTAMAEDNVWNRMIRRLQHESS